MAVLERSELQASPLADLHAIADQLGLEGFRRMRKADLIDAILGEEGTGGDGSGEAPPSEDRGEREAERPPDRSHETSLQPFARHPCPPLEGAGRRGDRRPEG